MSRWHAEVSRTKLFCDATNLAASRGKQCTAPFSQTHDGVLNKYQHVSPLTYPSSCYSNSMTKGPGSLGRSYWSIRPNSRRLHELAKQRSQLSLWHRIKALKRSNDRSIQIPKVLQTTFPKENSHSLSSMVFKRTPTAR